MSQLPDKPCVNPSCGKMLKPHEQFGANLQEPLCRTCHNKQEDDKAENKKEELQEKLDELRDRRDTLRDEMEEIECELDDVKRELRQLESPCKPNKPTETPIFGKPESA